MDTKIRLLAWAARYHYPTLLLDARTGERIPHGACFWRDFVLYGSAHRHATAQARITRWNALVAGERGTREGMVEV